MSRDYLGFVRNAEFVERLRRDLHRRPVGFAAHDYRNERIINFLRHKVGSQSRRNVLRPPGILFRQYNIRGCRVPRACHCKSQQNRLTLKRLQNLANARFHPLPARHNRNKHSLGIFRNRSPKIDRSDIFELGSFLSTKLKEIRGESKFRWSLNAVNRNGVSDDHPVASFLLPVIVECRCPKTSDCKPKGICSLLRNRFISLPFCCF